MPRWDGSRKRAMIADLGQVVLCKYGLIGHTSHPASPHAGEQDRFPERRRYGGSGPPAGPEARARLALARAGQAGVCCRAAEVGRRPFLTVRNCSQSTHEVRPVRRGALCVSAPHTDSPTADGPTRTGSPGTPGCVARAAWRSSSRFLVQVTRCTYVLGRCPACERVSSSGVSQSEGRRSRVHLCRSRVLYTGVPAVGARQPR